MNLYIINSYRKGILGWEILGILGFLTFLSSHSHLSAKSPTLGIFSFLAPRLINVSNKSWRPIWIIINFCSPNSLWLNFYPTSLQCFCSEKVNIPSPLYTSSNAINLIFPFQLQGHAPPISPPFSYYVLFLLHGPFSHLTNLLVVPCPKSKQKQIKDNTIFFPILLPKATVSFFPISTKRFYFSQRSWHVWWRRNLLLPNHFHTCHVMSLLSHCNIGVYTLHFNRPILWRIINHLLGARFLWPIFKPHSIWSLHN